MRRIKFFNADYDVVVVAKTLLAGCYKFGGATLLRDDGSTMTSVMEIYETR
jgi:hypothetical protein